MEPQTVYQLFMATCRANPNKNAYLYKSGGRWIPVSWAEQETTVRRVAKALIALGTERGERVGLLSQTRLEWLQCDLGISTIGAATVGVYPSTLAAECAFLLGFCGCRVAIVEDVAQLRKVQAIRDQLPELRTIVVLDGQGEPGQGVLGWSAFLARGEGVADAVYEERAAAIQPTDVAALVATSGTTGQPKLAMITHENLCFTSWSVSSSLPMDGDYTTLLFLPLAHVFARVTAYCSLRRGITVAYAESLQTVGENLKEIRPHFIASVPRIFEKVHEKILAGVQDAGGLKEKIFRWALGIGLDAGRYIQEKKPMPAALAFRHRVADRLVFHKIRAAFGGRLVFAISGAAPLDKRLGEFFHACGVLILEGIGMTENTSFSNVNRIDHYKFGSVGPVGPGVEMTLAEDGEVLYRGRNVMRGYFNNPEATAEAIDEEGWLHTGDIGTVDEDGFLRITDRKKDLIITAGGKNVAPQRIERILRQSPYVSQAVAFGDRKKYISALVTLDPDNLRKWAAANGLLPMPHAQLVLRPEVLQLVEHEIAAQNQQLASFEQVKRFDILPEDLSIEAGELTPTLKIKRKVVAQKYGHLVERLYADGAPESLSA